MEILNYLCIFAVIVLLYVVFTKRSTTDDVEEDTVKAKETKRVDPIVEDVKPVKKVVKKGKNEVKNDVKKVAKTRKPSTTKKTAKSKVKE